MSDLTGSISLFLFCTFLIAYAMKLFILYKQSGIKANVLAKGKKDTTVKSTEVIVKITTFLWGLAWLVYSLFSQYLTSLTGSFSISRFGSYIGLVVISIGLLFFILAMVTMKTSWRVGIDKQSKTQLVMAGIYKYSRNPAFVGFDIMFLGLFFTFPNVLTLFIAIINIYAIHSLILQEEKHLDQCFGNDYRLYRLKTPRYILFNL